MKSYIITSFAVSMFTFMGTAQAYVTPEGEANLPDTYADCLSRVGCADHNCLAKVGDPWEALCIHLKSCEENHSTNENDWRLCLADAEMKFKAYAAAPGSEPYPTEAIPVNTNAADANYWDKGPDHKGFLNAED